MHESHFLDCPWRGLVIQAVPGKYVDCMKHSVVARLLVLSLLLSACCLAESPAAKPVPHTPIMPLSEVRAGMHGKAYTVFEGVKPEPMDVEILGVLRNFNGPRTDLILVRL